MGIDDVVVILICSDRGIVKSVPNHVIGMIDEMPKMVGVRIARLDPKHCSRDRGVNVSAIRPFPTNTTCLGADEKFLRAVVPQMAETWMRIQSGTAIEFAWQGLKNEEMT